MCNRPSLAAHRHHLAEALSDKSAEDEAGRVLLILLLLFDVVEATEVAPRGRPLAGGGMEAKAAGGTAGGMPSGT